MIGYVYTNGTDRSVRPDVEHIVEVEPGDPISGMGRRALCGERPSSGYWASIQKQSTAHNMHCKACEDRLQSPPALVKPDPSLMSPDQLRAALSALKPHDAFLHNEEVQITFDGTMPTLIEECKERCTHIFDRLTAALEALEAIAANPAGACGRIASEALTADRSVAQGPPMVESP